MTKEKKRLGQRLLRWALHSRLADYLVHLRGKVVHDELSAIFGDTKPYPEFQWRFSRDGAGAKSRRD